jgi:site-specific recombinase XerD
MDTGCRIEEILTLAKANIDFENLLIKVLAKGSKARIVPFRFALRKSLYQFVGSHQFKLVFLSKSEALFSRY